MAEINLTNETSSLNMEQPVNSQPAPPPEVPSKERLKPVAQGKMKKESRASLFFKSIIAEDIASVKTYVIKNVVVPSFKKLCDEMITQASHHLFGVYTTPPAVGGDRFGNPGYVSYGAVSTAPWMPTPTQQQMNLATYGTVLYQTEDKAKEVLAQMDLVMEQYKVVSVLDLYDLSGLTSTPNDNKYGWTDIRSAQVVYTPQGWTIRLPKPIPLTR